MDKVLHCYLPYSLCFSGEFIFTLSVFIFNVVSKSFEDEDQEQVHVSEKLILKSHRNTIRKLLSGHV